MNRIGVLEVVVCVGIAFSLVSCSQNVKADPKAPEVLFSFETGTDGWLPASFNAGAPRRPIPAELLAQLEAWVHRTYVPASAGSRNRSGP